MKLALVVVLLAVAALGKSRAAQEGTVYSPYAADLDSFPNSSTSEGADIRQAGPAQMPGLAAAGMSVSAITLQPCTAVNPHFQPDTQEAFFVTEGKVTFGIVDPQGVAHTQGLGPGDLAVAPLGMVHYLANESCEPSTYVVVFTTGNYTRVPIAPAVASFGPGVVSDSFGLPAGTAVKAAPLVAPVTTGDCAARCGKKE